MSLQRANEAAILAAGGRVTWLQRVELQVPNGGPVDIASGFDSRSAVHGRALVSARRDPSYRECVVTFETEPTGGSETIDITINGITVQSVTTASSFNALAESFVSLVGGDPYLAGIITALVCDPDGTPNPSGEALLIRGVTSSNYSIELTTPAPTTHEILADAALVESRVWGLAGGEVATQPDQWAQIDHVVADGTAQMRSLDLRSIRRVYLEAARLEPVLGDDPDINLRAFLSAGAMRRSEL